MQQLAGSDGRTRNTSNRFLELMRFPLLSVLVILPILVVSAFAQVPSFDLRSPAEKIDQLQKDYESLANDIETASKSMDRIYGHYQKAVEVMHEGQRQFQAMRKEQETQLADLKNQNKRLEEERDKLATVLKTDRKVLNDFIDFQSDRTALKDYLLGLSQNLIASILIGIAALFGLSGYIAGRISRSKDELFQRLKTLSTSVGPPTGPSSPPNT